jgi:hypothetical protein
MTTPSPHLPVLQRWLLEVITHPQGIEAGVASDAAQGQIGIPLNQLDQIILPSRACSSVERLAVYGNAYFARLMECLREEFPAFHHAVGDDACGAFAFGYLQRHPPGSYTLSDLGRCFPAYLADSRPRDEEHAFASPLSPPNCDPGNEAAVRGEGADHEGGGEKPSWMDFLIDLATLERTYSEVFDGPGEEGLPLLAAEQLQAIPPENWERITLETSASLRLLPLRFPAHEYITAVRHNQTAVVPEPAPTWLAVSRREYIVRRQPLTLVQFRLLRALQQKTPLAAAIEQGIANEDMSLDYLARNLQRWFRDWTAAGYFRALALSQF